MTATAAGSRVTEELLGLGAPRPAPTPGLVETLRERITAGTAAALATAPKRPVVVTKATITGLGRCEELFLQGRGPGAGRLPAAVVLGLVVHKAITMAHFHPGRPVDDYREAAITAVRARDARVDAWLQSADMAEVTSLLTDATNAIALWVNDWPPMPAAWRVEFEPTLRVALPEGLVLHSRPDLQLGAARPDGQPSMVLVDYKVGQVRAEHRVEARHYALVSAFRHGVAPARSAVMSLQTGAWTAPPEVTEADLLLAADEVVDTVVRLTEITSGSRAATRTPGPWCSWCPLASGCPAALAAAAAEAE